MTALSSPLLKVQNRMNDSQSTYCIGDISLLLAPTKGSETTDFVEHSSLLSITFFLMHTLSWPEGCPWKCGVLLTMRTTSRVYRLKVLKHACRRVGRPCQPEHGVKKRKKAPNPQRKREKTPWLLFFFVISPSSFFPPPKETKCPSLAVMPT